MFSHGDNRFYDDVAFVLGLIPIVRLSLIVIASLFERKLRPAKVVAVRKPARRPRRPQ